MNLGVFDRATIATYTSAGHWDDESIAERIARHALASPDKAAFIDDGGDTVTWGAYDQLSAQLGAVFAALGLNRGDPVGVFLPDSAATHIAYVAAERAGLVAVGIGPRAGAREAAHVLRETGATTLVTLAVHRGLPTIEFIHELRRLGAPVQTHVVINVAGGRALAASADGVVVEVPSPGRAMAILAGRELSANELFFINSTSGTTGLPKCVMHTQNRWKYFHTKCQHFRPEDVFMVVVPAPFGFGLWMGHFSPTMLGATTILTSEFDVDATLEAIERYRVTVLAAVTTQVLMLLRSPRLDSTDLSSLRVVQSGGERVPFDPAAEFEERSGAKILQFYGSNEAGCVCGTTLDDTKRHRLGTAGRIFPEMHVRLFDDDGVDVTASGQGRSACKGPGITPGYFGNDEANAKLFRPDGWMYLGDIVHIDEDRLSKCGRPHGRLHHPGGQNISAPAVEEEVLAHPRVAMAAVVGMPDPVVGERVCVYVVTRDQEELPLEELTSFLHERGVSKYMWPERIVRLDELPTGSGGKIGKAQLRADIESRLSQP